MKIACKKAVPLNSYERGVLTQNTLGPLNLECTPRAPKTYFLDMELVKLEAIFKASSHVTLILITCTTLMQNHLIVKEWHLKTKNS